MSAPLVAVRGLAKSYGGVRALSGVSLDVAPGEIHALIGENGAGKSTLIKLLAGSVAADAGEVLVDGRALPTGDVRAAEAAGIAVIHQESVAFPHLDAVDNVFVGREPRRARGLLLDRARMRRETAALMERLGERVDLSLPVGELPLASRQLVAFARALSVKSRLLIMDEPTASLSEREVRTLFRIVRQLRAEGVAVLYVSHRLDEIFALCERVTVLRDGRFVAGKAIGEVTRDELIRLMVGRAVDAEARAPSRPPGDVALSVRGLSREPAFRDVSFDVRAGEIVGLAGLVGAGRSEVAAAIFGADRADAGAVSVRGVPLALGSIARALRAGIAMAPEDRQHLGLVLPMTVGENLGLAVLRGLTSGGLLSSRKRRALAGRLMGELAVRAAGERAPAETLSGGNQQKLVVGKWLATRPRVLILDEPTRGVDVGAKAEIHRLARALAAGGAAILLISSDLPEVLALSDRVLVMRAGRIAGELPAGATQEAALALAMPAGDAA